jgi:L-alanine-DL-glutamate epimerase-like enolase superfamily enzyme
VKITAVKGFPVKVGHRNIFIVKVETDAGIYGVGEGGMSGRELAMLGTVEHYERILVDMDPHRIEHIWQVLYRGQYFEGGKIFGAVISAIDIALWDILGKSLGVPVYQLLGGACRDRIECFATPGSLTGPECVERARQAADQGWRYLRFGAGMPDPDWTGADGAIYVGVGGHLYAINPNGSLKWRYDTIWSWVRSCPAIISDGTIYVVTSDDGYPPSGFYAVYSDSPGLANSSWPRFRQNNQNTGRVP